LANKTRNREELRIAEEAAEWLAVLDAANPEQRASFARWITESPLHLREFLLMTSLESELHRLDPKRGLPREAILKAVPNNVIPLSLNVNSAVAEAEVDVPGTRRRWILAAIAATVLLSAVVPLLLTPKSQQFATAVGEQRKISLLDGSIIYLNTKSRITVLFTAHGREVQLLEGEALFKVQHDPSRPFRVLAGVSVIQAVGTQFDVDRRPSATLVSVIEGRVQVSTAGADRPWVRTARDSTAQLNAGEEARIGSNGNLQRRSSIDPISIATWRQHRLVFRDDNLEDIAAEFNRYNSRAQIELEGDAVRTRRYTAVFDADDPGSFVDFLRRDPSLMVTASDSEFIIRSAP